MEKSLLIQLTGEIPLFRIIDFLIENKGLDFTKKDIAIGSKISRASLFNYWPTIIKYHLVKPTRKFGKTVLFTLNSNNLLVKKILELEKTLVSTALLKEKNNNPLVSI